MTVVEIVLAFRRAVCNQRRRGLSILAGVMRTGDDGLHAPITNAGESLAWFADVQMVANRKPRRRTLESSLRVLPF